MAPLERLELPTRGVETRCSNSTELKRYIWCFRLELNQRRWALQAHALPAELQKHMYRWFPGLEPTTLLDLYIPKTIHKLTPWSRVLELNQFKAGCSRLHDRPDHSAWSLLTVTIRFLESHNLVCYHYTKAGICTRHSFNSSLKGRCVSRERLLYVSYVWWWVEMESNHPSINTTRLQRAPLPLTVYPPKYLIKIPNIHK